MRDYVKCDQPLLHHMLHCICFITTEYETVAKLPLRARTSGHTKALQLVSLEENVSTMCSIELVK